MITILSDSQAAVQTSNGGKYEQGGTPKVLTGIKAAIKQPPVQSGGKRNTRLAWVRSHIGMEGNEKRTSELHSSHIWGRSEGQHPWKHKGVLCTASKAIRAVARTEAGFGNRRCEWDRGALSAYTWMRTDRGPQRGWLSYIGNMSNELQDYGHEIQVLGACFEPLSIYLGLDFHFFRNNTLRI